MGSKPSLLHMLISLVLFEHLETYLNLKMATILTNGKSFIPPSMSEQCRYYVGTKVYGKGSGYITYRAEIGSLNRHVR